MDEQQDHSTGITNDMLDIHRAVRQPRHQMEDVLGNVDLFIWTVDPAGGMTFCSSGVERIFGVTPEEILAYNKDWHAFVHPDDRAMITREAAAILEGKTMHVQYRIIDHHGVLHWLESWAIGVIGEAGEISQYDGVTMDVTSRFATQTAFKDVRQRYETLLHMIPDAVVVHRNGRIRYANLGTYHLLGYDEHLNTINFPIARMVHREDRRRLLGHLQTLAQVETDNSLLPPIEIRLVRRDGSVFYGECASRTVQEAGEISVISVVKDMSDRKKSEAELRHMAFHDYLTGLPNRRQFHEQIRDLLAEKRRLAMDEQVIVLLLDMDRFKNINDTHGHSFGDLALQAMSERLREHAPQGALLFRIGGDEFVIVYSGAKEEVKARVRTLLEGFRSSLMLAGLEFFITPSIGIALYPDHGEDSETLLKHADLAMYTAKTQGGNHYAFYEASNQNDLVKRTELELSLRRALDRGEFCLYYQPKYELAEGYPCAAEALVRWLRPGYGVVAPGEFITVMEESDMIVELGSWVLHETCRQMKVWKDEGYGDFRVSVNVSPRQFQVCDMAACVQLALSKYGISPGLLTIEITEGLLMRDSQEIARTLRAIREMGVGIAIDDFGTGYSSLRYLQLFHPNILKIDQSFIQDMLNDAEHETIVKTLVQLAHNLGMIVVAEGVETAEQVAYLREQGCELAQGYYFSRPVPAAQFAEIAMSNQSALV